MLLELGIFFFLSRLSSGGWLNFCVWPSFPFNPFGVPVINTEWFQIYEIQSNYVLNLYSLIYHNDNPNHFSTFRFG